LLKGLSEPAGYMTALCHTILTKLPVFRSKKYAARLKFLENVHCNMNLMVKRCLGDEGCRNVMLNSWGLIEKRDGG
jgi:hypothetical protein